ncbi:homoserine kinase [Aestuariimicrobium soli]|uniref:homoserine kinase n=1 Tax=Aestuariimicrobium soli TaxID=2035834 RepID=UPI003EB924E0
MDPDMSVTVRVPATSANLGPGFDAMGLALDLYDEVTVTTSDRLGFTLSGEGADEVPRDESHLVVTAIRQGLVDLGHPEPHHGLHLRAHNVIPHSRGLGSSAAAIGAGLVCAWAMARPGTELDREWLLDRSSRIEGHPDNAGAVVHGGAVLAWMDADQVGLVNLQVDPRIEALVYVPPAGLSTAKARRVLPGTLRRSAVINQASRAALLVHALAGAPDQLWEATRDWLHQEQRASLMPDSHRLRLRLRAAGVAAAVSGAGTTIIALGTPEQLAEADTVSADGFTVRRARIGRGAHVVRGEAAWVD